MGGKGSGRPKGGKNRKNIPKQLEKLKSDEYWTLKEGHSVELTSKRYRHYSYNKQGEKYHTLIDKASPELSFRGIPDLQYKVHLKRLAKGQNAYEKLWIYGREGTLWRMENARKGVLQRIRNEYNIQKGTYSNGQTIYITLSSGKTTTVANILRRLEALENSEKWIQFAEQYHSFIEDDWIRYTTEMQRAPSIEEENRGNEVDETAIPDDLEDMLNKLEEAGLL